MTLRNLLRACRNLMTSPLWWSKNVSDASHRAASSRRDSSGVIEHFPLSHDRCRQGCFHMGGAHIEVACRPSDYVRGRAQTPESAMHTWPVQARGGIVRKNHAEVEIAVRPAVTAGGRAEQI